MIAAVEDVLSEAVLRKLVSEIRPELSLDVVMRKNGKGYLQSRARDLNRTAHSVPVFMLADLDLPEPCPADLIRSWLGAPVAANLLFRIAVMEIEAWVMADREPFAAFLGVPLHRIPVNVDTIAQPKEYVVSLARKSRRRAIREDMVPLPGGTAVIGPGFNARIGEFIATRWQAATAAENSPSLRRTVERLKQAFR